MKSHLHGALGSVRMARAAVSVVKAQSLLGQSFHSGFSSEQRTVLGEALHLPDHRSGLIHFVVITGRSGQHVFSSFDEPLQQKTIHTFSRGPGQSRASPHHGEGRDPVLHNNTCQSNPRNFQGPCPARRTSGTPATSFPLRQHNEPEQRHPPLPWQGCPWKWAISCKP